MAYADYDFYKTEYYGNVISETEFARLSEKASDKLDELTFDRIPNLFEKADEKLKAKIQKATCNVAEIIMDLEQADANYRASVGFDTTSDGSLKGKQIKSISAGAESITYTSESTSSMVSAVITDRKARERLLYDTAREYLGGTGLLYAGL